MQFKEKKKLIIGLSVAAVLILLFIWDRKQGRNDNRTIKSDELAQIKGTLANRPTIEIAEQGSPWVPIKLNEYPDFKFDVSEIKYSAFKAKEFVTDIKQADTITLDILSYDYDTKIKKDKPLRISEKLINYSFIEPYGLKANGKSYMTLDDFNKAWTHNKSLSWVLYIAGGLFLIFIIAILLRKPDNIFDDEQASR